MNRRRFVLGCGSLAASGAAMLGTGAFSSTSAERDVSVTVVNDRNAYLRLMAVDTDYAYPSDGEVAFNFDDEFVTRADGGYGPGTDSVYEFDDLFSATNQGTQAVRMFGKYEDADGVNAIELYDSDDSDRSALTESSPSRSIATGELLMVGMRIDTHDVDLGEYQSSVTIGATADESGN